MKNKALITGGAGFIGSNAAKAFIEKGWYVKIIDNLSRKGSEINLEWLKKWGSFNFEKIDIRNENKIDSLFKEENFDIVLHLAAQVAVTTSVLDPKTDFEINAIGTLNILEAIRKYNPRAFLIYSSTNKVYGEMSDFKIKEKNGRYEYADLPFGVDEKVSLDLYSPYGCSKGSADQYVIDYSRIYGLLTTVFRQSCIYGPRQFGIEDQGWVAWFIIAAVFNKEITIFGDGKQIRDILHVKDLINLYMRAIEKKDQLQGNAFNIGGGVGMEISLIELIKMLSNRLGTQITHSYADWRSGDQKVYVSDNTKAKRMIGWIPEITPVSGVHSLVDWVLENKALFYQCWDRGHPKPRHSNNEISILRSRFYREETC